MTTFLIISLIIIGAVLILRYLKTKSNRKPLIPDLGNERYGIRTVTVNITMAELKDMSAEARLRSYVVRYLVDNPIPDEQRIDQTLVLRYVEEATRLLQFSYTMQFKEPLICMFNPATFYREVLADIERLEAHNYRKAHPL